MRLLTINYEFPPLGGGGGRANAQIAREMAALGHEVVVITSSFRGLPRKEKKDGYLILRIPTLRRYLEKCRIFEMVVFMLTSIFYSVKWVGKWRPDMTIAFFTLPSAPAALVLKKLFKIPYIVSLRGGDVPGFMKEQLRIYHAISLRLIRYIWKEASAVVANSFGLKDLALKSSRKVGITVIPNGVDAPVFREPRETAENGRPFRILTVGRLSPQKRVDVLLSAFAQLKNLSRPVQLWIVGDGPLRQVLEGEARSLGVASQVSFFGWQDQETLIKFYSSSDLFVLSSDYEGMPNVILEAMAAGLPVVATKVAGAEEVVVPGENGMLVSPGDPARLALAIASLISDEATLGKMRDASLRLVSQYNWQEIAVRYLKLCQHIS